MRKIRVGETVHPRELITIVGERIRIPDQGQFVHLQFRRFAGCAGCNLHLREFAKRLEETTAAGIREVAVFYSPVKAMMPHQGDLPFRRRLRSGKGLVPGIWRRDKAPFGSVAARVVRLGARRDHPPDVSSAAEGRREQARTARGFPDRNRWPHPRAQIRSPCLRSVDGGRTDLPRTGAHASAARSVARLNSTSAWNKRRWYPVRCRGPRPDQGVVALDGVFHPSGPVRSEAVTDQEACIVR
jgi:hypothetical protein